MRVLVTGAFGFVGNAVVRELAGEGHEVWALTSRPPGTVLPELPVARVVHADLRRPEALRPAFEGVAGVCHLAGLTNGRESFTRAEEYHQVNTVGTATVLDLLREHGVRDGRPPRAVLASTAAVYGTPERQPVSEDTPTDPGNPYGASKVGAEQALHRQAASGGLSGAVLRGFNIAGAVAGTGDADESRIIPRTLAVAAGRYPDLGMNGDGSAVRDFVHVADLARAFALALGRDGEGVRTYNVGATAASMSEIVLAVQACTGRSVPVRHQPPQPESPRVVADTALIRRELGWQPERSDLATMIGDAWAAAPPWGRAGPRGTGQGRGPSHRRQ